MGHDDGPVIYNDKDGDTFATAPAATRELRAEAVAGILRAVQRPDARVVKVTALGPRQETVRGYVTMARFLHGMTPAAFESRLGLRAGTLARGCTIYDVPGHTLTADNIAPRAFTDWPAGISPREVETRTRKPGKVFKYSPDYPPALDPIPQFVIHREVPAIYRCTLLPHERFETM